MASYSGEHNNNLRMKISIKFKGCYFEFELSYIILIYLLIMF